MAARVDPHRVHPLELEAGQLDHVGRRGGPSDAPRTAASRGCRRRRGRGLRPGTARRSSAVVVLLPLVPVTPTTGTRREEPRGELHLAPDRDAALARPDDARAARAARPGSPPPGPAGRGPPRPSGTPTQAGHRRAPPARPLRAAPCGRSSRTVTRRLARAAARTAASPLLPAPSTDDRLRPDRGGHAQRSLSDRSATPPQRMETIQKRTMIFGSRQPLELEVVVDRRHPEDALCRSS